MNAMFRHMGRKLSAAVIRALAAGCLLAAVGAGAQPSALPNVHEIKAGDTFSAIAAQYTGSVASWRRMYHPQLSGIANPNRIAVGTRLEVAADKTGRRYLRLASPAAARPATAAAGTANPAAASASPANATAATDAAPAERDEALVVGVLPNVAAATLHSQYEHLKRYLERQNKQKVRIMVPANFKAFFDSLMRGEYDLAVAGPHLARVAQVDRNLVPLVMYEPRIGASLIVPADAGANYTRELQGKSIAFANPQSLVAMYGRHWLSTQMKLEPGRDYEVKAARTDMGVGRLLLTGEASAAIMSQGEFRALPADEASRLKVAEVFARIPNFIVLANAKLASEKANSLRAQLKGFLNDQEDGVPFARATGLTGIVDADNAVLRELDPYVAPTRKAMGYDN